PNRDHLASPLPDTNRLNRKSNLTTSLTASTPSLLDSPQANLSSGTPMTKSSSADEIEPAVSLAKQMASMKAEGQPPSVNRTVVPPPNRPAIVPRPVHTIVSSGFESLSKSVIYSYDFDYI